MKSTYLTIHPGKNPPPQNGCRLKSVFFLRSTGFTSSTFPIHPDLSQNQTGRQYTNLEYGQQRWLTFEISAIWTNLNRWLDIVINYLSVTVFEKRSDGQECGIFQFSWYLMCRCVPPVSHSLFASAKRWTSSTKWIWTQNSVCKISIYTSNHLIISCYRPPERC